MEERRYRAGVNVGRITEELEVSSITFGELRIS